MIPTVTFLIFVLSFCGFVIWLHKSNDPLIKYKATANKKKHLKFKSVGSAQFGHCVYRFTLKFAHSENRLILRDQSAVIPLFYVCYEIPINHIRRSELPEWDYVLVSPKSPNGKIYCRMSPDVVTPDKGF